jgi:hypothetical protein
LVVVVLVVRVKVSQAPLGMVRVVPPWVGPLLMVRVMELAAWVRR